VGGTPTDSLGSLGVNWACLLSQSLVALHLHCESALEKPRGSDWFTVESKWVYKVGKCTLSRGAISLTYATRLGY
jgi:hypothetical protein